MTEAKQQEAGRYLLLRGRGRPSAASEARGMPSLGGVTAVYAFWLVRFGPGD
jgi:hypothetical protein